MAKAVAVASRNREAILRAAVVLANGGQNLGQGGLGGNALQECDRVAGLDRLDLFLVAEHLDGHTGLGAARGSAASARADQADLVHDETVLASGRNSPASMALRSGWSSCLVDAGDLEGVGLLPPRGRHADNCSSVRMPGLDKGLE